jgi:hypothetical protein
LVTIARNSTAEAKILESDRAPRRSAANKAIEVALFGDGEAIPACPQGCPGNQA